MELEKIIYSIWIIIILFLFRNSLHLRYEVFDGKSPKVKFRKALKTIYLIIKILIHIVVLTMFLDYLLHGWIFISNSNGEVFEYGGIISWFK